MVELLPSVEIAKVRGGYVVVCRTPECDEDDPDPDEIGFSQVAHSTSDVEMVLALVRAALVLGDVELEARAEAEAIGQRKAPPKRDR